MPEVVINNGTVECCRCQSTNIQGLTKEVNDWEVSVRIEDDVQVVVFTKTSDSCSYDSTGCTCRACGLQMEIPFSVDYKE